MSVASPLLCETSTIETDESIPIYNSSRGVYEARPASDLALILIGSIASSTYHWNSAGNLNAGRFLLNGNGDTTSEFNGQRLIAFSSTVRNLFFRVLVAPGGITSRTMTVRKNGIDTALTCTITGASVSASDVVNVIVFSPSDLLSIRHTVSGSPAATGGIVAMEHYKS